jgi:glutamate-ammonia-ligase adenylyltransferase
MNRPPGHSTAPAAGPPSPLGAAAGGTATGGTAAKVPVDRTAQLEDGCRRALRASNYLQRALRAQGLESGPQAGPAVLAHLLALGDTPWTAQRLAGLYEEQLAAAGTAAGAAEPAAVGRALRRLRRDLLCGLMVRDCAGIAPLDEVTGAMTAFAELAVQRLLAAIAPEMAARYGCPVDAAGVPQDLLVLAMGKAGSGELNVSSDLDLIFAYGEVAACRRPGEDAAAPASGPDGQEFFDRLGRRLIGALGDADADGFVFRIDMRLRPHGESGPLVVSLAMLEEYLVRDGREWERFAWAKARVISGPVLADAGAFARQAEQLDAVVQPFIYRKYFDFGAIGAIRDLHQRIRGESRRRALGRPERELDVKIGRGGIREIEFLAQTFCIMRGGRERRLRARGTVATLQTLARLGLLAAAEAERLIGHYRFLRRLEHALQYRDDAQTHLIPPGDADRNAVAELLGMASGDALLAAYRDATADVVRLFDGMFPADPRAGAANGAASAAPGTGPAGEGAPGAEQAGDAAALARYGFTDPEGSAARLQQLLASPRVAAMSAGARAALEQLAADAVQIIRTLAQRLAGQGGASADEMLLRWIRLMEVIGRRSTYLSLLAEYPMAHERVLGLLASGGWASQYLLQHPILLDELIDLRAQKFADDRLADDPDAPPGSAEPYWAPWIAEVDDQLLQAVDDVERQMNILRDAHHAQVFRLLLADLAGSVHLERLGDHLSALADGVLALTLRAAWRSMDAVRAAPDTPPPRLAIIAYGKLGGRELGYVSDLDLTFVYEPGSDPQQADRDAAAATHLVRRLMAWLTTVTSSGTLFEIDVRLRPNGNAGLMVTPIEAFDRYESNADGHGAWVWEHQALTRARGCAGDPGLCARIERVRERVLAQPRDPGALAAEVVAMRLRMLEGHPNRGERFDIKHDRGGMVDVEFIVQFLVLAHAHAHAGLLANRGNIGLLAIAAELGLVGAESAAAVAAAYRRFRQLQHALRLNGAERARVEHALVRAEIAAVLGLWRTVFGTDAPQACGARPAPARPDGGAR